MRRLLPCLLAFAVAATACKTAGGRASTEPVGPDPLQAYVGELRFVHQDRDAARIEADARSRPASGCVVAVRVRAATLARAGARFALETLGSSRLNGHRADCKRPRPELELVVSDLPASPEERKSRVDGVLLTSERYLAEQYVDFDLEPAKAPGEIACREVPATDTEARLARSVAAWPVALLSVDPWYRDATGRVRQQSEVELETVVGCDGRVHKSRLRTPLGEKHAAVVLRSLPLWRFTPARTKEKPVAARLTVRPVLHIY